MSRPGADRVMVEWSGTGTGTMSLGSAVTGFQSFPSSLNGQIVSYSIEHTTSSEAEAGFGTYTSSSNTLSRTFRTYPTVGGSAVDFSAGAKLVRLVPTHTDVIENRSASDPTTGDDILDGYIAGRSRWLNTTTDTLWFCTDHTAAAAIWVQIGVSVGSGHTIQEDGVALTARTGLNFTTGITASDNAANNRTNVQLDETYLPSAVANYRGAGNETLSAAFAGVASGDATPVQVLSNAATYALTTGSQMHTNAEVRSHQANVDFEVPAATPAGRKWLIKPKHDGCIVSTVGNVGSVNGTAGGTANLVTNGVVIVEVDSNPGLAAPAVLVLNDVVLPPTVVSGTKTYDDEDANQEFRLTSTATQTIGAAAGFTDGFICTLLATSGTTTIDGADADYSAVAPDEIRIRKVGTAMWAIGKAGVVVLDAA